MDVESNMDPNEEIFKVALNINRVDLLNIEKTIHDRVVHLVSKAIAEHIITEHKEELLAKLNMDEVLKISAVLVGAAMQDYFCDEAENADITGALEKHFKEAADAYN